MKPETLERILKRTRRRVTLTSGVQRAGVGLMFGAVGGLVLIGVDRLLDAGWPWWIPVGACGLGAVGGFISSFLRPPASADMAVLLDRALGLKDRIGTAEAIERGRIRQDAFAELVKRDAARVAAGISPASIVPWRFGRPWLAAIALVGAVGATHAFLPSLAWSRAPETNLTPEEREELVRAQQDVASTIEQFADPARTDAAPVDERAREQYDRLADLAQQLQEGPTADPEAFRNTRDEASSTLNRLAEERAREAERTRESMRRLTERFDRLTPPEQPEPTNELERALRDGDFGRAAQMLEQLDRAMNELAPADRRAAAERLREIADTLRDSNSSRNSANDAGALRDALRGQGVDDATIDELLNRDREVTPRDLIEQGVDPETARSLARETEQARRENQAESEAERTADELAERFDNLANEVESPPADPRAPSEPTNPAEPETPSDASSDPSPPSGDATDPPSQRDEQTSPPTGDRAQESEQATGENQSREERDGTSPPTGDQQSTPPAQEGQQQQQGENREGQPGQSQQQQQSGNQQEQQQQQQGGDPQQQQQQQQQQGQTGEPGGTQPGQQQQGQQEGQQQSGENADQSQGSTGETTSETTGSESASEQSPPPGGAEEGAAEGEQSAGERTGEGESPQQQSGDQPGEQSSDQSATEQPGASEEGGTEAPSIDPDNLPSAQELRRMLDQLEQQRQSGEQSAEEAERMRQAAQEIAEKLTPEERERLQEWAQQMQQELGEDAPSNQPPQGDPRMRGAGEQPGDGGDGSTDQAGTGARGNTTTSNPNRLNTGEGNEIDLRGDETAERTLAEVFDNRPPGEPTSTDQATPGVVARDARRAAEQAVNNATIHRRYHELIRRYFDRLPETLDEASKPKRTGESSSDGSGAESSSSNASQGANEGGSSR